MGQEAVRGTDARHKRPPASRAWRADAAVGRVLPEFPTALVRICAQRQPGGEHEAEGRRENGRASPRNAPRWRQVDHLAG
jgi:hypothetical protein